MGTDIHGVFQKRTALGWEDVESNYEQNRHYQLFAVLANVRNGFGFAGIRTGEPVEPIAQPRGLPADFVLAEDGERHPVRELAHIDPGRRSYIERDDDLTVWMGDHSHSWLTGAEMLDWAERAPTVTQTGVLSRREYEQWDKTSHPESYCSSVGGASVVLVNDNRPEMDATPDWNYVRCHWQQCLKQELAYFFDEVARLVAEHGEVRFVFGFDS